MIKCFQDNDTGQSTVSKCCIPIPSRASKRKMNKIRVRDVKTKIFIWSSWFFLFAVSVIVDPFNFSMVHRSNFTVGLNMLVRWEDGNRLPLFLHYKQLALCKNKLLEKPLSHNNYPWPLLFRGSCYSAMIFHHCCFILTMLLVVSLKVSVMANQRCPIKFMIVTIV